MQPKYNKQLVPLAKQLRQDNPSVKNQKIFDSSLYTREPWALPRQYNMFEFDS